MSSGPGRAAAGSGLEPLGRVSRWKDTLLRGALDLLARGRGAGHLLGIGELGQQPQAEVLAPLVLLPPVDEDFVLQSETGGE